MAIPAIADYPLPADLPPNRVGWTPDPRRSVLLIHDMQRYFLAPYGKGGTLRAVVATIARLRARCAGLGVPVVYTAQPGDQDPTSRGLLTDFWGAGIPAGPATESIVDELRPGPDDRVLVKHRYSAFVRTDLDAVLAGRDQLIVTGVYGHIGILATATDAFMRDVQPFVVADAIADFSADRHATALELVAMTCGAVLPAAAIDDTFSGGHMIATLRAELTAMLGEEPADDADLFDLGLDSVRLMTLVERLREQGHQVDVMDLAETPTVKTWAALLA